MRYAKSLVASLVVYATIIALYGTLNYQDTLNLDVRLLAPSLDHPFGTDMLGRDVLQRVLFGFFPTFFVAITATICSLLLAAILILVDRRTKKFGDITMAVPAFLWALAFMATMGPGILNVTIALTIVSWPFWARLLDSMLTQEETKGYVDSAIAIGLSHRQILWRHIFPNIMPVILSQLPIQIAHMILVFAGLSFLGYGAPPDIPEWGRMIYEGKDFMSAWWITLFPGLSIFFSVLALQTVKIVR